MTEPFQPLLQRCVSVDLEVDPATATVFAFAAVRDDARPAIVAKKRDLEAGLDRLEVALAGVSHLLGHNIIRHDLPHLVALRPRLAEVFGSPIDTLWLNPLAFPRNPYHHLVKHYHDGRLQAGHINDPELDQYLHLGEPGRFPLQLSGERLPSGLKLVKSTEPVKIVDAPKSKKDAVLVITEIDVQGDKASVRYRYDIEGIRGNVSLSKKAHGWELKNSRLVEH